MPSPIGHALGGLAAGWLVAGVRPPSGGPRSRLPFDGTQALLFAGAGVAPDLDLLAGTHSTYTHSLGAVLITVLAVLSFHRGRAIAVSLGTGAALGSHILLDWLGSDTTPPIGVMALWPFSQGFYQSDLFVFMAITRRYWQLHFYVHNAVAALREIAILVPVAAAVWWVRGPSGQPASVGRDPGPGRGRSVR